MWIIIKHFSILLVMLALLVTLEYCLEFLISLYWYFLLLVWSLKDEDINVLCYRAVVVWMHSLQWQGAAGYLGLDLLGLLHPDEHPPWGASINWLHPSSRTAFVYTVHLHTHRDSHWYTCTHTGMLASDILGTIRSRLSQSPSPSLLISKTEELSG